MRSHLMKSFVALMVFGALLALASPGSAQDQFERAKTDRLIRNAEHSSGQFVAIFDQSSDSQDGNNTERDERMNARARDLADSLNRLRKAFDQGSGSEDVRSELANAMHIGEGINTVMNNHRTSSQAQRQWSILRADLNRLAAIFNVRQFS